MGVVEEIVLVVLFEVLVVDFEKPVVGDFNEVGDDDDGDGAGIVPGVVVPLMGL